MPQHIRLSLCPVLVAIFASALTACNQPDPPEPMLAVPAADHCPSPSNPEFYLAGTVESAQFRDFSERWTGGASRVLASMGEPALSCGPVVESYRLVWIHSFDNWQPTALRLNRQRRQWSIVAVRLLNAVDQRIVERTERPLTDEAAERALAAFGQFALWQQPSFAVKPDVMDGAMWIVEGRRGSAYHAVLRSNVAEEALRELAMTLFDVSGMDAGKIREE
jgi:hypothetical protein